eukprot:586516-Pelagomonas_calceolata.AAC.4
MDIKTYSPGALISTLREEKGKRCTHAIKTTHAQLTPGGCGPCLGLRPPALCCLEVPAGPRRVNCEGSSGAAGVRQARSAKLAGHQHSKVVWLFGLRRDRNALYKCAEAHSLLSSNQAGFHIQKDTIHQLQSVIMGLEDAKAFCKDINALIGDNPTYDNPRKKRKKLLHIETELQTPTIDPLAPNCDGNSIWKCRETSVKRLAQETT